MAASEQAGFHYMIDTATQSPASRRCCSVEALTNPAGARETGPSPSSHFFALFLFPVLFAACRCCSVEASELAVLLLPVGILRPGSSLL